MSIRLHIQGEYPTDWSDIGDRVRAEVGHRCIRCGHPFETGKHGKGQWTPCDEHCTHAGPLAMIIPAGPGEPIVQRVLNERLTVRDVRQWRPIADAGQMCAEWRILTVHHLDGNKANCVWWNLLALCQRCHLQIQTRLNPQIPYFLEHSDWFKPYVAGFYANKYEGRNITREEAMRRLDELLAYERRA